jgi:hypothetical protein
MEKCTFCDNQTDLYYNGKPVCLKCEADQYPPHETISSANLAPHVTHKIEVTGTAVPANEAEADKNVPKAQHYMKLTAIKMISATCP